MLLGDDRSLSPHAARLRDPIRIALAPYSAPSSLATVLEAAGTRARVCVPGCGDMATYGRFVRVVTAISRRDLVDAGRVQLLTNSTSLFALYGHDGATAGYARILPVLRCALPRLRDPELDVDALCAEAAGAVSVTRSVLAATDACLLLAAYIASRSPRDHDAAIFAPGGKRQRADPYDATQGQIDKPRAASLDRILAIHAFLAAEHLGTVPDVRDPGLILTLANLVAHSLIGRNSSPEDLTNPRFTCLLDSGPAFDLADAHRVPLGRYLPI